ncbi:SEC-C motif-containing protein [Alkalithermobacter thermoalcaliphilus JW-YL-7 = DSM 7308]|uniref:SEC-C motif domain protein n=1 Tax=Alkalithermobacter thermoalcaliphilus JW-YL-7 = DSM 7308 TaxID=1121328 RepID=A0A150FSQ8_CLOPD|nr:SEC-C motif domain protein [[Clostridium] paradoxum JW-YL-7 = DSM 7308]SHL18821.1 SEC-C motif-containing protein [[Clostridium] paradoxum JW-YL-7 = DSM 7308]
MSLFEKWRSLCENLSSQEEIPFWEDYFRKETNIYKQILKEKMQVVEGKVSDLADKYNVSNEEFMGFLDGISESLKNEISLETIQEDTNIKIEIDFEKLYYNMVKVEATWLYNLDEWEGILPKEKRKEIEKEYKSSKTIVKEDKIGRNEPCICGSGKKYKKCCGK